MFVCVCALAIEESAEVIHLVVYLLVFNVFEHVLKSLDLCAFELLRLPINSEEVGGEQKWSYLNFSVIPLGVTFSL